MRIENIFTNSYAVKPTFTYFVVNPQKVYVSKTELAQLKPVSDVFEKRTKIITLKEVKELFPFGLIDVDNYLYRAMQDVLSRIEPKPKSFIDLSPELTEDDYKLIAEMMNFHGGKYIDVWKGYSDTDLIPNIQKLALFNRSMRLSKQAEDFLQFNPAQWDVVVEGIVRKPKDVIVPLLEYKVNSDEINRALSTGEINYEIQKKIDAIENYLNLFETKKEFTVYRGEGGYGILNSVKIFNCQKLGEILKDLVFNINIYSINEIKNIINSFIGADIQQKRFMSTAMTSKATDKYAQKILWKIKVPAGTKGTSIESFNIEREAEAEFLIQRNSFLTIKNLKYNFKKGIYEIDAILSQPSNIDTAKENVRIKTGV